MTKELIQFFSPSSIAWLEQSGLDMALNVGDQESSDASNGNWPSSYRLFGDFLLEEPEKHLSQKALNRLRELEPHFRGDLITVR